MNPKTNDCLCIAALMRQLVAAGMNGAGHHGVYDARHHVGSIADNGRRIRQRNDGSDAEMQRTMQLFQETLIATERMNRMFVSNVPL